MSKFESALFIIAICAFGSLIIEARTHRLVSKSMHRHALSVMSDKTNKAEANQSEQQDHKGGHLASPLMPS
jgi:hypothetical protein